MLRELKTPFFTVLFIFLGLLVYTKLAGPLPFSVTSTTTTKESLFTVQGQGEVAAVPDTALLNFGVNKEAANVESAKNEVNKIINKITDDLKALGVPAKDIRTTNYSVNPNYDYALRSQTVRGYSVSANIEVKIKPIEKANQAVDIATKDGATQVGGVQFTLDDDKQKELEDQARREAIKNAKEKAESISSAAGIRLGKIIDVQENGGGFPLPYRAGAAQLEKAADTAPPTELSPGENKVTISISLSYETY